jgi:predicted transcriptional regulator
MTDTARLFPFGRKRESLFPEIKEIREKRIRVGLSQRDLAKKMGVSQSTIAKIERGTISPSYSIVRRIFTYLDSVRAANFGKAADVASKPVMVVQKSDGVEKVVQALQSTGFKQLPVKDGELLVGCVYERSISRHIMESNDVRAILRRQVGQIMDESLPTVSEDTSIPNIIPLLQQAQAILVTKQGRVTGIVTNTDLLKLIRSG